MSNFHEKKISLYFCTIKEKDGNNDKSQNLSRNGIFRLSIGVPKETYNNLFGEKPKRRAKGCIVEVDYDLIKTNILTPHPVYAWMSWLCILSPSQEQFEEIYPLIIEAPSNAIGKFNKKDLIIRLLIILENFGPRKISRTSSLWETWVKRQITY